MRKLGRDYGCRTGRTRESSSPCTYRQLPARLFRGAYRRRGCRRDFSRTGGDRPRELESRCRDDRSLPKSRSDPSQRRDLRQVGGACVASSLEARRYVRELRDDYIIIEDAVVHSHGPEGEHSHGQTAVTTWLDPRQAVIQARAIRDALAAAHPEQNADFEDGLAALEKDLVALDARMEETVGSSVPLVASQPVYQYFARRYGLNVQSVDFEDDAWHNLEHLLEDHPAELMLWKTDPPADTAARLRGMGIAIAIFDPCGNRPTSGDYLSVMEENVARLQSALSR